MGAPDASGSQSGVYNPYDSRNVRSQGILGHGSLPEDHAGPSQYHDKFLSPGSPPYNPFSLHDSNTFTSQPYVPPYFGSDLAAAHNPQSLPFGEHYQVGHAETSDPHNIFGQHIPESGFDLTHAAVHNPQSLPFGGHYDQVGHAETSNPHNIFGQHIPESGFDLTHAAVHNPQSLPFGEHYDQVGHAETSSPHNIFGDIPEPGFDLTHAAVHISQSLPFGENHGHAATSNSDDIHHILGQPSPLMGTEPFHLGQDLSAAWHGSLHGQGYPAPELHQPLPVPHHLSLQGLVPPSPPTPFAPHQVHSGGNGGYLCSNCGHSSPGPDRGNGDGASSSSHGPSLTCGIDGCSYKTHRKGDLKRHQNTALKHNSEKKHKCSVPGCDKSYSRNHPRNKHEKTHRKQFIK